MARRVFFSFHFENDIWRVNQVRNANVFAGPDIAGFFDHSEYAEAKTKGVQNVQRLIRKKLRGTSVTVVLIGQKTASRPYVKFEIQQSIAQSNGLLGVFIDHLVTPNDLYIPLLSEANAALERLLNEPEIPKVPKGTEFPVYRWDGDIQKFSKQVELAGKRADKMRSK